MRKQILAAAACSALLSGCELTGSKSSSTTTQDNTITGQAAVQILSTTEQTAADNTVNGLQSMPTTVGGRLDAAARAQLQSANTAFRSDLSANSANTSAKFGLAVTSLALVLDNYSDSLDRMWNNGLQVGSSNPGGMFQTTPVAVAKDQAFAARSLQTLDSTATIRQLQNTVELHFMPTVDSVVTLLTACWSDPNFTYRFPVSGFSEGDSLTIGRADVGLALAGVMAVRDYLVWLISQDLEAGFAGQGFPTQYAWYDTLSHIDDSLGPQGASQTQAFQNLQTLLASGSTFLGVRAGYTARVDAIPSDLKAAAAIAKSAMDYALKYQVDDFHGLVQPDTATGNSFKGAMDSVDLYLSGPRTFVRASYKETNYVGYQACGDTYCFVYDTIVHPSFQVRVDLAKAITLRDRKVFLPRFQWNAASDWPAKGPYSLVSASGTTTFRQIKAMDVQSPLDLDGKIEWIDPTFGGVFPDLKSSHDVLAKLDEAQQNPVAAAGAARRLVPTGAGF
jgi:hypothetical protein